MRCAADCMRPRPSTRLGCRHHSSKQRPLHAPSLQRQLLAGAASSEPITQDALPRDLIRFYFEVQEPALANRPYSKAVTDFTNSAILAYECGYSEEHMRLQMQQALQAGDCGIKASHAQSFNAADCLVSIMLVWLTLMASPKTVKRWATVAAVSDSTQHQWQGFVKLIVNAYFEKRMAWYSIDRLSMEVAAMGKQPEAPDVVAERARLVFTTLEKVYPQFPSDS